MPTPAPSDHFQEQRRGPIAQPKLAKMCSGMIRSLHEWWLAQRGDDIPDRAALRPEEFKSMLPYMLVSEVVHNPFRIRYRLAGTVVVAVTGMEVTGRYLHELDPSDDEPWMAHYMSAYRTRAPVFGTTWLMSTGQVRYPYEFGIFPLRKGGTDIAQFVSIEDYFDFKGPVDELVGWRLRSASKPAGSR
jgi:hypothetical protein